MKIPKFRGSPQTIVPLWEERNMQFLGGERGIEKRQVNPEFAKKRKKKKNSHFKMGTKYQDGRLYSCSEAFGKRAVLCCVSAAPKEKKTLPLPS